jgi:hypothetical protein
MHPLLTRSTCTPFVLLATACALAAPPAAGLKARCDQLVAYYDRYGSSRSANSDGARNMTRVSAFLDCQKGRYEAGIKDIEDLLRRKRFTVPPPDAK